LLPILSVCRLIQLTLLLAIAASSTARAAHPYAILGAIWSVTRDLDLDFGLKRGTSAAATDNAVLMGATLRW